MAPCAEGNRSAFDLGTDAVTDSVLDERLQDHRLGTTTSSVSGSISFLIFGSFIAAKAHHFDIQVVVNKLNFLLER